MTWESVFWAMLHAFVSGALVTVAVIMLVRWRELFSVYQRLGLGLIGGAGLLRIDVIMQVRNSPFFDWAPTLAMLGVLLFVGGTMWRLYRHDRANTLAKANASAWLEMKGRP